MGRQTTGTDGADFHVMEKSTTNVTKKEPHDFVSPDAGSSSTSTEILLQKYYCCGGCLLVVAKRSKDKETRKLQF